MSISQAVRTGERSRLRRALSALVGFALIGGVTALPSTATAAAPAVTVTSLAMEPGTAKVGETVHLTATVTSAGSPVTVGRVAFDAAQTTSRLWGADSYVDPYPDSSNVSLGVGALDPQGRAGIDVTITATLLPFLTSGATLFFAAAYEPYSVDYTQIFDLEYAASQSAPIEVVDPVPAVVMPPIAIRLNGVLLTTDRVEQFYLNAGNYVVPKVESSVLTGEVKLAFEGERSQDDGVSMKLALKDLVAATATTGPRVGVGEGRHQFVLTYWPDAASEQHVQQIYPYDVLVVPTVTASAVASAKPARTVRVSAGLKASTEIAPGSIVVTSPWDASRTYTAEIQGGVGAVDLPYPAGASGSFTVKVVYRPQSAYISDRALFGTAATATTTVMIEAASAGTTAQAQGGVAAAGSTSVAEAPVSIGATVPGAVSCRGARVSAESGAVAGAVGLVPLTSSLTIAGSALVGGGLATGAVTAGTGGSGSLGQATAAAIAAVANAAIAASVTLALTTSCGSNRSGAAFGSGWSARTSTFTVSCARTSAGYTCPLGVLPVGARVTVSTKVPVPASLAGKKVTLKATLGGRDAATGTMVTWATKTTTIQAPRRTALLAGMAPVGRKVSSVKRGKRVTMALAVGNAGVIAATKVKVCVNLSPGATVAVARGARVRGRQACWTLARLKAGSTVQKKITLRAPRKRGRVAIGVVVTPARAQAAKVTFTGSLAVK